VTDHWNEYNARFKALGNWVRNVAEPFDLALVKGKEGVALASAWARRRQERKGFADPSHQFRLQGSADLNSYKMFTEVFWNLLKPQGRFGVILPSGLYSDLGSKDLREALLYRGQIDFLYAFQNEKRVFPAVFHGFVQIALFAERRTSSSPFRCLFRLGVGDSPAVQEIPVDILRKSADAMEFTPEDIGTNCPRSLSFVELRSRRDADLFGTVYRNSLRLGDPETDWKITSTREFHMTDDSRLFPPLEDWERRGFNPNCFGEWVSDKGDRAFPLYEGRMINQFEFSSQAWISGHGTGAQWNSTSWDNKLIRPRLLTALETVRQSSKSHYGPKILYRDIARNTDTRTMIAAVVPFIPTAHTLITMLVRNDDLSRLLLLSAYLNSLCFDYVLRNRKSGTHLSWFVLEECPIPNVEPQCASGQLVSVKAARLTLLHRRFSPEWLKLRLLYPELASKEWKHWWAVTEADRLRLRVEIDALCADLYGLRPDDFDWIVRDDPTDPKGFYRVDRQFPFQERLTGLAAAAFRALKECKWTAESSASLSNDEFFDLLGVPEMTNAQVAHAKRLPGPLIEKRDGCHMWHPENFPEEDPRHGWTWEDCWNDAVALLGSQEAVREYVKGRSDHRTTSEDIGEVFELRREPSRLRAEQQRFF
jgi:hypothetical protein